MAENAAESLNEKGMRVIAQGRLVQRSYEKDGEKRSVVELQVEEIGPSLRYAKAQVAKTPRNTGAGSFTSRSAQTTAQDPWGTPPTDPPF